MADEEDGREPWALRASESAPSWEAAPVVWDEPAPASRWDEPATPSWSEPAPTPMTWGAPAEPEAEAEAVAATDHDAEHERGPPSRRRSSSPSPSRRARDRDERAEPEVAAVTSRWQLADLAEPQPDHDAWGSEAAEDHAAAVQQADEAPVEVGASASRVGSPSASDLVTEASSVPAVEWEPPVSVAEVAPTATPASAWSDPWATRRRGRRARGARRRPPGGTPR